MQTRIGRYDRDNILGLPTDGKFIAISNSDVKRLDCRRRALYSMVEHLGSRATRPMDIGNAWDLIMQDVFGWWAGADTAYPNERIDPVIQQAMSVFHEQFYGSAGVQPTLSQDEYQKIEDTLRRMLEGYLFRWHNGPLDTIRIVATQVQVARQILNPRTGKPFRPVVLLERPKAQQGEPEHPWRIASAHAHKREKEGLIETKKVSWPWYQIGILDVLGADRKTNVGWVIDSKASSQPTRYEKGIEFDPQLPGYCWLLEEHLEAFGLKGIAGFMYDVANNKYQPDPHQLKWKPPTMEEMKETAGQRGISTKGLKSAELMEALGIAQGQGELSQAQNAGVPSWRYESTIALLGLDPAPYAEHIEWIAQNVDRGLYMRPWQRYAADQRERYGREIFAQCSIMAALRKTAASAETLEDLDIGFPRTPICQLPGGSCSYTGICSQHDDSHRDNYSIRPGQFWSEEQVPFPASSATTNPSRNRGEEPETDW